MLGWSRHNFLILRYVHNQKESIPQSGPVLVFLQRRILKHSPLVGGGFIVLDAQAIAFDAMDPFTGVVALDTFRSGPWSVERLLYPWK